MLYRELLVRFAMVLLVLAAGELLVFAIERAHAAPLGSQHVLGYRIRLTACNGTVCLPIHTRRVVMGKYGCESRAEDLAAAAAIVLNESKPAKTMGRWEMEARCVAIPGTEA